MLMKLNRKIINQCISVLMLLIYLFGSSAILSFHEHHEHHEHHAHHAHHAHHDQELLFCENLYQDSSYDSHCSHDSHVISLKEKCAICDHFSHSDPVILDISINTVLELVTVKEIQLFTSLYIIDANNTRNKSPPIII